MMKDLNNKALSEKYFKSIRYFSHLLKGQKKLEFLSELSEYNIYLAAQCLMSSERDTTLENNLKLKSESLAKDFANIEKSAKGFLALAEFESYETILSLVASISTPDKIHQHVFNKIFSESNEVVFLKFFEVLIKANKPILIGFLISAYNKEIIVTSENKIIIRNILDYLIDSKLYGQYRVFIDKGNLFHELSFILDKSTEEIIKTLLEQKSWRVIKLAYFIAASNNILSILTPNYFVEKIAEFDSKKGLMFAIKICVRHNLKEITELDKKIGYYLKSVPSPKPLKKNINAVNRFIRAGLLKYANENKELTNKLQNFIAEFNISENQLDSSVEYDDIIFSDAELNTFYLNHKDLNTLFDNYFNDVEIRKLLKIEDVIRYALKYHSSTLLEISHLLRKYKFNGIVFYKKDFGSYISSESISCYKNPFIHSSQVFETDENKEYKDLKEGDIINVRIVGINKDTYRLNLSCLSEFDPY